MESNVDMALDLDLDLDLNLDFDLNALDPGDVDFTLFDPLPEDGSTARPSTEGDTTTNRPYHSKRAHKKSRAGCKQCKQRKVKCDEGRPACRACTLRKQTCVYPTAASTSSAPPRAGKGSSVGSRSPKSLREQTPLLEDSGDALILSEPLYLPPGAADATDMKMLWFYTAETYHSFNIEGGRTGLLDTLLRVTIPQLAFQSPFLMQTLMGLSALQLKELKQSVPTNKAVYYRARAFEGYRTAIELARPQDYPALLASSLLMCALSTEMFRDPQGKRLYIIDWMTVWRGIGLIVEIISPTTITDSGLAALFYRPPINLNKSQRWIPNNLLFMVQSIKPSDADYEYQQVYYEVLRYLGSLYQELESGFSPIMDLRVITFFTFIPKPFIPMARELRPRALIILAHYCAFTKQNLGPWWMRNIGDRQIAEICEEVGHSWEHLLRVPRRVMGLTDRVEIAKTLLENDTWTAPDQDLYTYATRDPRVRQLRMINDTGNEVQIVDGSWQLMPPPIFVAKLQIDDPSIKMPSDAVVGQTVSIHGVPLNASPSASAPASQASSSLSPPPASTSPESPMDTTLEA